MENQQILNQQGHQLRAMLDTLRINPDTILDVFVKMGSPKLNDWTPEQIVDIVNFFCLFQSARQKQNHYIDPSQN
jgi:hypothetical protein